MKRTRKPFDYPINAPDNLAVVIARFDVEVAQLAELPKANLEAFLIGVAQVITAAQLAKHELHALRAAASQEGTP